ncbi:MAG: Ig-like domain-containing protein [Bifidobacteriaceae bacterium]|jgi:adhesin/invasin|nr:Ig-like domain-containing protein [Bifidobacteriaceae bacterium]
MAATFVTAVTGVVVIQSWGGAERSQAVTYNAANWNATGTFSKDELWVVGTGDAYTNPYVITNPWTATSADFISRLRPGYNKTGAVNGNGCGGAWENLAMGPALMAEGDQRIAHLGWTSTGLGGGLVFSGDGNCYGVTDLTPAATSVNDFDTTWGGEINQKTGEVYLVSQPIEYFDGDSLTNNPRFNIVKVSKATSGSTPYTVTRLAASPATPPAPGAKNLAQAAQAAGKTGAVDGNWRLGSDMAIDANGNAYRMARFDRTGPDYWALIRFNIPRVGGAPQSTGWTYNVVRVFDNYEATDVWGMAFLNGALYTGHADLGDQIIRWDPLSGANTYLGVFLPMLDMGSAQMAPVIEGKVYRDVDGDGVIEPGDDGLGGVVLEVWQQTSASSAPELRGTLTTDSDGSYSALLPSATDDFYLRLRPTQINGVNAGQSYASAGSYRVDSGQPANVVTPLCFASGGDYQPRTTSGACRGARADGIDPPTVTDPTLATGGANTVTKIDMNSDLAVVTADFGLTTGLSWGDAPDTYKTSNQALGPYGAPDSLHLGATQAHYPDGQPSAGANSHDATDDGLFVTPKQDDGTYEESDWVLAQNQVLTTGGQYRFRAKVSGTAIAQATAKAWLSPLASGTGQAATALTDQLLSGTPDADGYVYGDYTVGAQGPQQGLASVYARARVGQTSTFTSASRGSANPDTDAWVPRGEVEDYRLAVANGTVRVKARTIGGRAAHVNLALGNIFGLAPSQADTSILTNADGSYARDSGAHAVASMAQEVAITTIGVGGPTANAMHGWKLLGQGTSCHDSATGTPVAATIRNNTLALGALDALGATGPRDVTCELSYGASVSATYSTLEVTPEPDAANPLTAGTSTYDARVTAKGVITPAEGPAVQVPVPGAQIALTLTPVGGDGTATGASFTANNAQSHTCTLDDQGECTATVQASHRGAYLLAATAEAGSVEVGSKTLYFAEGAPSEGRSSATVTQTADQLANYQAPGSTAATWGKQTITVTVRDANDAPVTNAAAALTAAAASSDPLSGSGLAFAGGGAFACSVAPVGGACYTGVYALDVYSSKAGPRAIVVTLGSAPTGFEVTNADAPPSKVLLAPFKTPPASAQDSTLVVSPSTPADRPDDPDDVPDGVPNVLTTGAAYTVVVTAWDAGRNNKAAGAAVTLALTGADCAATFAGGGTGGSGGGTTAGGDTSALGRLETTVVSNAATTCTLTATVAGGVPGGSPKTLKWEDAAVDPDNSHTWFDVSTADIVANGQATGTITVSLYGRNGLPVTTVANLSASGPTGGEVTVGGFTNNGDGTYRATFTGTSAGSKLISVLQGAVEIGVKTPGGNDTANFVPGAASAEDSWLVQPTDSATADGDQKTTIGARVYDKNGNPANSGKVAFTIPKDLSVGSTNGPATIEVEIVGGWAQLQVASRVSTKVHGTYVVTAKIGAVAIASVRDQADETSELRTNGQVNPVFVAGSADPGTSTLSIPTAAGGATKEVGGTEKHRVQIQVEDKDHNPVADAAVRFDYTCVGQAGHTCSGSWTGLTTDPDGIAYYEWGTTKASTWTVGGFLGTEEVADSPGTATFDPGPPVIGPGKTRLESPTSPAKANGSETQTVLAHAIDGQGNAVTGQTVTFTVPADVRANGVTGPDTVDAQTDQDGIARLVATSELVGSYQVRAKIGATQITQGDPARIEFVNTDVALDRSSLTVTTAPAEKQVKTEYHEVKAELTDTTGQPYQPATEVTFSYRLGATGAWTTGPALTTSNGTVTWASFTVPVAGTYQVRAMITAGQVGTTQEAKFKAGPIDGAKTLASLTVSSTPVAADGVATVPASMKAQDDEGNPVKDTALTFELVYTGAGPYFTSTAGQTASGTSGPDGMVRASIASLHAGSYDVRGRLGADTSPAPYPKANFSKDVPDPGRSEFSVARTSTNTSATKAIADGSDSYTATILLRNAAGTLINGVGGTLYFTPKDIPGAIAQTFPFVVGLDGAPQGQAQVVLTALKAGVWEVSVKIGADPVATTPGGPVTVVESEFEPDPVHHGPAHSRLVSPSASARANGSDTQVVTAHVMDVNNNPWKLADAVFTIPANVRVGAQVGPGTVTAKTDDQGVATLTTTSTVVGEYDITARVGAVPLTQGSPAVVQFTNADLSLLNSLFTIPTAGVAKQVLAESHTLEVELFDSTGNVYTPSVNVTFSYRLRGTAAWVARTPLATVGGGVVWAGFTVGVAGEYEVKAEIPSGQVGTVLTARFEPGPVDPGLTRGSFGFTTGKALSNDSATHSAWVTVQDAEGNPIRLTKVRFTLDSAKAAHFVDPVTHADLGKSVEVESSVTGLARVWLADGTTETVHLGAALGADPVGAADFVFATDAPSAVDSSWVVVPSGPRVADGVQSFAATVTVRDASPSHLLVPGAAVGFEVPLAVRVVEPGPYLTGPDGRVTVRFTSEVAASYDVRALIGSDGIEPDPRTITFEPGAISFEDGKTTLRGPGVTAVANGSAPLTATATVRDAKDNPVTGAVVEFSVPAGLTARAPGGDVSGPTVVEVPVNPVTAVATVAYVTTTAGPYNVTARAKKGAGGAYQAIRDGSPARLVFTHGPADLTVSVIAKDRPGPLVADGDQAYGVTVSLFDSVGNPYTVAGVPVTVTYRLGARMIAEDLVTDAAGAAATAFATTEAGSWRATADVGGQAVEVGSPLALPFEPGPPSADVSVFDATTGNVLADGSAAHSAWVVVTDAQGNPVPSRAVAFTVATGSPSVPGPVLTGGSATATVASCDPAVAGAPAWCDQAGKALVYLTSNEPGSFAVGATLGGATVNGSPREVSFESGPADEVLSSYVITPLATAADSVSVPADGAASYTVTVTARSVAGLLVPGAQVRLAGLDGAVAVGPSLSGVTGSPSSGSFGTFGWRLSSASAGSFSGRVQVSTADGWRDVGGPFLVRFAATGPVAGNSRLTIPTAAGGATRVADGSQAHRAQVELRDANHNLVPGAEVVFAWAYPDGGRTVSGTWTAASGIDGVAVYEFSSTRAATWTVAATVGGGPVAGSPQEATFVSGPPVCATSELISPTTSARENGEGVQAVTAILRDAFGNAASCWDEGLEAPCEVAFAIPERTWMGEGAARISGPAVVAVRAGLAGDATGAGQAVIELYGDEGLWQVFALIGGEPVTRADGVASPDGAPVPARVRFTDAIPPGAPLLDPSDGQHVTGIVAESDLLDAAAGDLVAVVVHPVTGEELGRCVVEADGTFDCALPGLGEGATIHVRIDDSAGNASEHAEMSVDATAPGVPSVEPSDGSDLVGEGEEPGDTIIVTDQDGNELCRTTVGEDLGWSCSFDPPLKEGDMVTITERDPSGNVTERPWRIGVPRLVVDKPVAYRGDRQTATGFNFQPGEDVTGVMRSDPVALGSAKADPQGKVVFAWVIPEATEFGAHKVEATGSASGVFEAGFTVQTLPLAVQALPFTGADGLVGAAGSALGLLLAGWLLLAAARRRRAPSPDGLAAP